MFVTSFIVAGVIVSGIIILAYINSLEIDLQTIRARLQRRRRIIIRLNK